MDQVVESLIADSSECRLTGVEFEWRYDCFGSVATIP